MARPSKEDLSKAGRTIKKANPDTKPTPKESKAGETLQKGRKK